MKAIGYQHSRSIDQQDALIDIELPMPEAQGRDLLVKIEAISVNPVDTKIRQRMEPEAGEYKVLGWDAAGEVIAVGGDVELFKAGDKVWYAGDLTRQGSNAEFQLVDERIVGKRPQSLSVTEAAAMPLTAITAWELLFDRLMFTENSQTVEHTDRRLLIIGAAGGVGSILIQLAKTLTTATVIGTASRPASKKWIQKLGADHVIDHTQAFLPQLKELGIDTVTDVISLNHTDQHFDNIVEVIAPQGKIGLIDDPQAPLDIMKLKMKSVSLHWEFMYTRSMFQTDDMRKQHELLNRLADLVDDGIVKSTLGAHYGQINAANLKKAHAHIESGQAVGKIVLQGF